MAALPTAAGAATGAATGAELDAPDEARVEYLRTTRANQALPFGDRHPRNAEPLHRAWCAWTGGERGRRLAFAISQGALVLAPDVGGLVAAYATSEFDLVELLLLQNQPLVACALADCYTVRRVDMRSWQADIATMPPRAAFAAALYRFCADWRGAPIFYEAILLLCVAARGEHPDAIRICRALHHVEYAGKCQSFIPDHAFGDIFGREIPRGDMGLLWVVLTVRHLELVAGMLRESTVDLADVAFDHLCLAHRPDAHVLGFVCGTFNSGHHVQAILEHNVRRSARAIRPDRALVALTCASGVGPACPFVLLPRPIAARSAEEEETHDLRLYSDDTAQVRVVFRPLSVDADAKEAYVVVVHEALCPYVHANGCLFVNPPAERHCPCPLLAMDILAKQELVSPLAASAIARHMDRWKRGPVVMYGRDVGYLYAGQEAMEQSLYWQPWDVRLPSVLQYRLFRTIDLDSRLHVEFHLPSCPMRTANGLHLGCDMDLTIWHGNLNACLAPAASEPRSDACHWFPVRISEFGGADDVESRRVPEPWQ